MVGTLWNLKSLSNDRRPLFLGPNISFHAVGEVKEAFGSTPNGRAVLVMQCLHLVDCGPTPGVPTPR